MTLERISPGPGGCPRTTEAAVSSQLVSIPRMSKGFGGMVSIYAKGQEKVQPAPCMNAPLLRLASRGSPLALVQSHLVRAALGEAHGWDEAELDELCPILTFKTTGDRIQDRPLV